MCRGKVTKIVEYSKVEALRRCQTMMKVSIFIFKERQDGQNLLFSNKYSDFEGRDLAYELAWRRTKQF